MARREPAVRAARAARPDGAKGRASRASAARAACSSTVSWCAPASCWRPRAVGQAIVTVEGIAEPGAPSDVQQAFVDAGAVQCGFCTPGLIVAAHALLDRNPQPTETEIREELSGNICRCTGYGRIIEAVQRGRRGAGRDDDARSTPRGIARRQRSAAASATVHRGPTGIAKVQGAFAFSGDLSADGVLWGATLRSPHPYARIVSHRRVAGVEDRRRRGGHHRRRRARQADVRADQPATSRCSPADVVRYVGEPVAAVAADHPETCRRALAAIVVDVRGARAARSTPRRRSTAATRRSIPTATSSATSASCAATRRSSATSSSRAPTRSGMQDQAFLGLEAALAMPDPGGAGVELYVATQWLHEDRTQIAACLGLPDEKVRLDARRRRRRVRRPRGHQPAGAHLPAGAAHRAAGADARTAATESFLGHVHRHPATIWMRHHATRRRRDRQDRGPVRARRRRLRVDVVGRADQRASPTPRARTSAPNAVVDGYAVRTNHLPCGAMRGFGVVQACFAHEGQMDRLAAACGLDPVEIRLRNAMETGDRADHRAGRRERGARSRGASARPRRCRCPTCRSAASTATRCGCRAAPGCTADAGAHPARRRLGRGDQEPDVLRGVRRLLDGPLPARRRRGHAEVRHVRGRPGLRHDRRADRPVDPRRRRGRARTDRHRDRLGRLDVGVAPDVDERGRGRRGLPGGARAAVRARRRRRTASTRCGSSIDGTDVVDSMGALRMSGRRRDRRASRSTRRSSTTTARPRISTRTARATATRRSRSSPTAPWSTSTPSSAW